MISIDLGFKLILITWYDSIKFGNLLGEVEIAVLAQFRHGRTSHNILSIFNILARKCFVVIDFAGARWLGVNVSRPNVGHSCNSNELFEHFLSCESCCGFLGKETRKILAGNLFVCLRDSE